jgi:hypothetical protein
MTLGGWSWEVAKGPAGLGDRPLLEALEAAIPDETVEATIEATGTRERRRRRLPTHLVVTLVVAMGLWASESMRHVLAEVVAGWREGVAGGPSTWRLPSTAAIVQAEQHPPKVDERPGRPTEEAVEHRDMAPTDRSGG